jgi:hypothetical protein
LSNVSTYFSIDQVRKNQRAKRAKRFQPDYELLNETVVILDKLAGAAAQKTDLTKLSELLSRIKQAERRFPELPLGTVVAHIDTYREGGPARRLPPQTQHQTSYPGRSAGPLTPAGSRHRRRSSGHWSRPERNRPPYKLTTNTEPWGRR